MAAATAREANDAGDEVMRDEVMGDEVMGDEVIGDEVMSDEVMGDETGRSQIKLLLSFTS